MSAPSGSASPISNLLEELLIIIFDGVVTSDSSFRCGNSQPPSCPENLACVYRAWRNIVFACPMLWKYVHITPVQSILALKEHLRNSSPLPIHLAIRQRPFRNPIASGSYSIAALTDQLQSVLLPLSKGGDTLARCAKGTINAIKSSAFLGFVLQTWTGRSANFLVLRRVTMDGNVCTSWSGTCFFNGNVVSHWVLD